jgi:putative hydrolase of the HAD superfamily
MAFKGFQMYDSIRTVLFDLDGTLVFHQPDSFELISAYLAEMGQPLDPAATLRSRRIRHQYFADPLIRDERDGLSRQEFWQHFNHHLLEAIGAQGDLDQMTRELTARFLSAEFHHYCPEEACRTLAELQARGYLLGLLTNRENVERFHALLTRTSLWPYFQVTLASGEVGISKPDPGIFHTALERAGSTAAQSLYVGDNYWADVVGAQRAGITPILLDPHLLFPEASCLVLEHISDLLAWLP